MLALVLASSVLAGMGWFGTAGVSLNPGLQDEQDQVESQYENPSASSAGSDEFSLVRGALDTIDTLRVLTTQAKPTLERLGVPTPIAAGIGTMVGFAMAMVIVQIIRGIRFG